MKSDIFYTPNLSEPTEAEMECCDAPYRFKDGSTAGSECGDSTEQCFDCRAWCCTNHSVNSGESRFCLECAKDRELAFICVTCQETFPNAQGLIVDTPSGSRECQTCTAKEEKRNRRWAAIREVVTANTWGGLL